jgi:hypothetical protein
MIYVGRTAREAISRLSELVNNLSVRLKTEDSTKNILEISGCRALRMRTYLQPTVPQTI